MGKRTKCPALRIASWNVRSMRTGVGRSGSAHLLHRVKFALSLSLSLSLSLKFDLALSLSLSMFLSLSISLYRSLSIDLCLPLSLSTSLSSKHPGDIQVQIIGSRRSSLQNLSLHCEDCDTDHPASRPKRIPRNPAVDYVFGKSKFIPSLLLRVILGTGRNRRTLRFQHSNKKMSLSSTIRANHRVAMITPERGCDYQIGCLLRTGCNQTFLQMYTPSYLPHFPASRYTFHRPCLVLQPSLRLSSSRSTSAPSDGPGLTCAIK
ncbi:unnamed protein product [Acanthosepion pharaonis]|uniref:Uncharacterized protein n=1 Tax=Acanthosepion pharaonis TaxID=158019 RepID=A0A812EJ62_ACAPH|nr:unnamed protein product [Sepia pharaonis]